MEEVFLKLLHISIIASWLIVAIVVLRLLLKQVPKNYFCILWGVVAIRLICPFSIETMVGIVPNFQIVEQSLEKENDIFVEEGKLDQNVNWNETDKMEQGDEMNDSNQSGLDTSEKEELESDNQNTNENQNHNLGQNYDSFKQVLSNVSITSVLSIIWIVGMIAMFLYSIISYIKLRSKVRVSLLMKNRVYICDNIRSPFLLGIFNPKIYVPSTLEDEQILCVVMHEETHLKRHDHWWKTLGFFLLIIYWFHPLVWIAYILFCRDMEMACDEAVIQKMSQAEKKFYLETLLFCSNEQRRNLAYPLAFGETGIKERVKFMVRYKKPSLWIMVMASILCVTVVACFGTSQSSTNSSEEETTTEFENETDENGEHVHTVVIDEAVAPTCLEGGLTEGSHCPVCRKKIEKQKKVEALGHDFVDGVCTRCGGEMEFSLNKDGTYAFAGVGDYNAEGVFVIPSQYKGKPVTAIAQFAFWKCKVKITSVEIPDSVTHIGERAFGNMLALTSINIPDSVTTLENFAFYACYDLEEVVLSKNLTEIGDFTFAECTSLKNIDIPDCVTCIGMNAFAGAGDYTEVWKIPDTVTTIEDGAFFEADFQYIEIPSSVTYIGKGAFRSSGYTNDKAIMLFVEAEEKPDTWDDEWCGKDVFVLWGYKKHKLTIESHCHGRIYRTSASCSECGLEIGETLEPVEHIFRGDYYSQFNGDVSDVDQFCEICDEPIGNLKYTKNEDGTYKVTGIGTYLGETIKIPMLYKNKLITSIEEGAFADVEQLKAIAIDSNITHIGKNAFRDDENLTIIVLDHESKPDTWDDEWCGPNTKVIWKKPLPKPY